MERDRARLPATDRPRPFRFENLGSWARLDDGDVFSKCPPRNAIRTITATQAAIKSPCPQTKIWNHPRHESWSAVASHWEIAAFSLVPRSSARGGGVPPRVPPAPWIEDFWPPVVRPAISTPIGWGTCRQGRVSALRGLQRGLLRRGLAARLLPVVATAPSSGQSYGSIPLPVGGAHADGRQEVRRVRWPSTADLRGRVAGAIGENEAFLLQPSRKPEPERVKGCARLAPRPVLRYRDVRDARRLDSALPTRRMR
jgi:hypothetical protein